MEEFESPPYKVYSSAHTRLNNYIKISIVAVEYLFKAKPNDKELSELINELIKDSGERWTPRIFNDPKKELTELKNDLAKTGIIWVYSAFDVFFKKMEGSLSGFFKDQAEGEIAVEAVDEDDEDEPDEEEKKETKIIALYKKLGWPLEKIQDLLPILKFYELLRHCVAHRSGYPSEKLVKVSNSDEFKNAIVNWKTKFAGKNISPPPVVSMEKIELKGHHAILYSETCLRIAKDMNHRYSKLIDVNYLIGRIIKRYLIDTKELHRPYGEDLSRYIVYHLKNDYNILVTPYKNIYDYYGEDEETRKEHNNRYTHLKRESSKKNI
ncbi:MAG: hypothetical protein V4687_13725 [Bacteroidota bacterium]